MKGAALSVQVKTKSPLRVARQLAQARASGPPPTAGVVFLSGALAKRAVELGGALAEVLPGTALLIAVGAGILTEQGEREREDAASALLWRQGSVRTLIGGGRTVDEGCLSLADQLRSMKTVKAGTTGVLFARPDGVSPSALQPLARTPLGARLFGGGTMGGCDPVAVDPNGSVTQAPLAGLLLHTSPPLLRSSPACRLLCEPMRISRARGSMVLELDGEPALDVLSRVGRGLPDSPLVFAVLDASSSGSRRSQLIRAVQGVDPIRSGLIVSEEATVGRRLSFGIRDAAAARSDLERCLHEMEQELAGAAPIFGIYVNCAGRGSGLYGVGDVDTRLIRHRFGNMPVAGMQSSFEIVPMGDAPALQLYSGVMALFTAPS